MLGPVEEFLACATVEPAGCPHPHIDPWTGERKVYEVAVQSLGTRGSGTWIGYPSAISHQPSASTLSEPWFPCKSAGMLPHFFIPILPTRMQRLVCWLRTRGWRTVSGIFRFSLYGWRTCTLQTCLLLFGASPIICPRRNHG